VESEAALSARLALSCSASLAFSSAWLYQDRAPLRVVRSLLELVLSRSECYLPLRRHNLHRGHVLARLLQRLVSCQECGLHHLNRRGALRSLHALVQELVSHGLQPVLQPPVIGPQGLHEGVEGVVLVSVPVPLDAQPNEAVVPLPGSAFQLLSPAVKSNTRAEGNGRTDLESDGTHVPRRSATKDPRGPASPRSVHC
jgi:hypothetical protein